MDKHEGKVRREIISDFNPPSYLQNKLVNAKVTGMSKNAQSSEKKLSNECTYKLQLTNSITNASDKSVSFEYNKKKNKSNKKWVNMNFTNRDINHLSVKKNLLSSSITSLPSPQQAPTTNTFNFLTMKQQQQQHENEQCILNAINSTALGNEKSLFVNEV